MGDRSLNAIRVLKCDHKKPHVYRQRQFDVLNGFELTLRVILHVIKSWG